MTPQARGSRHRTRRTVHPCRTIRSNKRSLQSREAIHYARRGTIDRGMVLPTLDRKVLADVSSQVIVRTYAAGTAIIRHGDAADRFFIIQEGEVDVEVAAADGAAPRVVNRLGRGDYFGEIGLLTGSTRNATVRTTRETQVMELDRGGFMTMISTSDLTSQELSRVMRQRVVANGLALALPSLDARQAASLAERVEHRHYDAGKLSCGRVNRPTRSMS